jgi:hypothetical protein
MGVYLVMTSDNGKGTGVGQRSHGIVFVTELPDSDDTGRFSGEFAAHWESDDGAHSEMGPVGATVEEGIVWGRTRSDVVLVQVGGGDDGNYSAGKREVSDGETRPWPPAGINVAARPEKSALDGSEQIVKWSIKARIDLGAAVRDTIILNLNNDDRVVETHGIKDADNQIELILLANGATAAMTMAWRVISAAIDDAASLADRDNARLDLTEVTRVVI